jgi:hypothetical protein
LNDAVEILRKLPLEAFEAPQPDDAWARCPLASAGDGTLVQSVAAAIARPKVQIDSSVGSFTGDTCRPMSLACFSARPSHWLAEVAAVAVRLASQTARAREGFSPNPPFGRGQEIRMAANPVIAIGR